VRRPLVLVRRLVHGAAGVDRLAAATGDQRYAEYAHAEFKATSDYLYDRAEHLFYRDSRFFEQRDSNGRKLFWSRGNGWVFAGIARVLERLPAGDPMRPMYEELFKEMAAKLKAVQKADGYWAAIAARVGSITRGIERHRLLRLWMAWGIKAGLLDRADYEPVVRRGWQRLERAVHSDGMLGSVQQVSDRPEQVAPGDTQFYGVGAFLLAGPLFTICIVRAMSIKAASLVALALWGSTYLDPVPCARCGPRRWIASRRGSRSSTPDAGRVRRPTPFAEDADAVTCDCAQASNPARHGTRRCSPRGTS
jgi:hypothetical protein